MLALLQKISYLWAVFGSIPDTHCLSYW